jgi:D-alanine transaminase
MADALPICLLNGVLLPTDEARISPFDRGFLFGDGIYEVVPCYGGKPFRLPAHFDRMQAGLDAIGIANPYSPQRWNELVQELIAANGCGHLGIYIEITRGPESGRDFLPSAGTAPTVFGFCWRLTPMRAEQLERGVTAATLDDIRWLRCDIKSVALLGPVMLRMEAKRRGADEAILIRDEHLAEGSSSAVCIVKDGRVITPPPDQKRLPSITRLVVGEAVAALGIPLDVREIHRRELYAADEIWIASSTREALAVTHVDERVIGGGKPGPVWRSVFDEFQALKKRESA